MESNGARRNLGLFFTALAMMLGLGLSGWSELAPVSYAAEDPNPEKAVQVPEGTVSGLPGFADLAEAVSPAVVSIQSTTIERRSPRRGMDPFEFFFRGPRQQRPAPESDGDAPQQRSDSTGSGFVISSDGLIVTNHHVIEGATEIHVNLGERRYTAEVKGDDPATDLAVLKIEPERPLTYLDLAPDNGLRVGDWIMVIGSPLQLTNSVSVGVVSAMGRSINITPDASLENFIQTDAAINFGNSGGPLVDLEGRVVGIATAINFGAENIGFAVPVSTLRQILPQLIESGAVRRGYLGVFIGDLDPELAESFGYASTEGVLVTNINSDSPSYGILEPGDIIVRADDIVTRTNRDLIQYVSSKPPGAEVQLQVFRNGKTVPLTIELGERPGTGQPTETPSADREGSIEWLGIEYRDLDEQIRSNHGIPEDVRGVWVRQVAPTSPLYDGNVRPGDVVRDVGGQSVDDVEAFERLVNGAESGTLLRFYVSRFDPRTDQAASFFAVVRVP